MLDILSKVVNEVNAELRTQIPAKVTAFKVSIKPKDTENVEELLQKVEPLSKFTKISNFTAKGYKA